MRKLVSLAMAASMLLGPATALAEFSTPSDLLTATRDESRPQNFSITAKGHADDVWFAVWASGASEGSVRNLMSSKGKVKFTFDIVRGGMKIRAKAQLLVQGGNVYVKLDSIDGGYQDVFMTFKAMFGQNVWLKLPLDDAMFASELNQAMMPDVAAEAAAFNMTHTKTKGGHTYTLTLTPEAAVEMSDMLREALGAQNAGTSDDFFPFRDLANESLDMSMKVDTNNQDVYQHSSFTLHWMGGNAEITMNGTAQRQSTPVYVEVPKNAWTMEDVEKHYNELMGVPSYEEDWTTPTTDEGMTEDGATFDSVDTNEWWQPVDDSTTYSEECWNPEISPLKKLQMQRSGECPIEDYNNRTFRR